MTQSPPAFPIAEDVLARFRSTAPQPGMVMPDYQGFSTCNVAQLIWRNFGLPNRCPEVLAPVLDRPYRRIILLIMDALGWNQLHDGMSDSPAVQRLAEKARMVPLTVTFPSTTTVALTAIYTGLTPVEHTITGHMMYLREVGAVVDVLRFSPAGDPRREVYAERGVDVHQLFPMYTVFEPMEKQGLDTLSITRGIFTNTALGWLHHVGADVSGYLIGADMFVHLRHAIQNRKKDGLIAVYYDVVDMLSHEYGPFSDMVRCAVDQTFHTLEKQILNRLTAEERADTLLLITADHGQCDVLPDEAILLSEQPRLRELLMLPPTGQGRAAYLYANQGEAPALGEELHRFDDRLWLLGRDEALKSGVFGPPELSNRIRHRIGDYVGVTRGATQVMGAEVIRDRLAPKGHHGSLGESEMIVPLIALPLDAW